ncbi:MAG TPA: hypothetical protein VFC78_18595 [Tepidisphaeraceae bacterium]|nr:hypothetical protein [Tepidisphaeraceae bacterium]
MPNRSGYVKNAERGGTSETSHDDTDGSSGDRDRRSLEPLHCCLSERKPLLIDPLRLGGKHGKTAPRFVKIPVFSLIDSIKTVKQSAQNNECRHKDHHDEVHLLILSAIRIPDILRLRCPAASTHTCGTGGFAFSRNC